MKSFSTVNTQDLPLPGRYSKARPCLVRGAYLFCPRKTILPPDSIPTIPVFVVSLPDCTDRRETISQALHMLGIEFEFVDAVDGRQGLDPQYEDQIDRAAALRRGRILSVACALSHINVYRRIVSENIAYALILEDDAIPYPALVEFLAGSYYRDADLTQLYCSRPWVRRRGAKRLLNTHTSYLRTPRLNVACAVAYTVSNQAAFHLATHAVPVNKEADWPWCLEDLIAKRQCRVIVPSLAGQASDNGGVSLIHTHGRRKREDRRRIFGIAIPPFRRIVESASTRAFHKLLAKRLP